MKDKITKSQKNSISASVIRRASEARERKSLGLGRGLGGGCGRARVGVGTTISEILWPLQLPSLGDAGRGLSGLTVLYSLEFLTSLQLAHSVLQVPVSAPN